MCHIPYHITGYAYHITTFQIKCQSSGCIAWIRDIVYIGNKERLRYYKRRQSAHRKRANLFYKKDGRLSALFLFVQAQSCRMEVTDMRENMLYSNDSKYKKVLTFDILLILGLLSYAIIFFTIGKTLNPLDIAGEHTSAEGRLFWRGLAEMIFAVCSVIYILGACFGNL